MNYKVTAIIRPRLVKAIDPDRLDLAAEMQHKYDLPFSLEEIIETWEEYSDSLCAGWLMDDKESIEQVFGVELEEIK